MDCEIKTLFPPGHFYSPICDPNELRARQHTLWPATGCMESAGVDYRITSQLSLLQALRSYSQQISFPLDQSETNRYFYRNDQYPCLDAEVLYSLVRMLMPQAFIEVGSGFSTLVTAEINRLHFDRKMQFTLVEPYPRQFLIDGVCGVSQLLREKVENVNISLFETLHEGDVLFIDSSHVAKTGSDVNYLFFEVLPRLRRGVYVHIHDVFLPDEYPQIWAIEQGRNWNEQYLVRAFLQFNNSFEVIWASHLMATRFPQETAAAFPNFPLLGGGGSLWLRRC
jgi:hypothetical protein